MKLSRTIRVCSFVTAGLVCFPVATHGATYLWDGSSGAQFTNTNNWTPVGEPGATDTATFRLGAVPAYPVWLFQGIFDPINRTVDRMIVGTNTVSLAGGVLTVDGTDTTETGRALIIGQTASDVAVVNSGLQALSTVYATLGSAAGSSGTLNVNAGSFNITGLTPTYDLIVGLFGSGAINVSSGHQVNISDATVLGLYSGSSGTATVSGAGTTWDNSGGLVYVGRAGSGAIDITGGGQLTAERVTIAFETGSSGDVSVSGPNSKLTSDGPHVAVGYRGTASMEITDGGSVVGDKGYVGHGTAQDGSTSTGVGTALVDGADSNWTNTGDLFVGSFYTTGTLTISNGGRVTNTGGYIGYDSGMAAADRSVGTVNVTGSTSLWDNSDLFYVGYGPLSDGTLNITSGGRVNSGNGYVGYRSGSTGNVTVDGLNSLWNTGPSFVGGLGSGTLTVTNNGAVQAIKLTIFALGVVRGNGTLIGNVENGGLVAPGASLGTLDITGNYTQTAAGGLLVELASTASHDRLEITGTATLGGTLAASLSGGFMPSLGDTFTVLTFGARSGDFSSYGGLDVGGHLTLRHAFTATSLVLTARPTIDGDINLDGTVNIFDVNSVSSNWSTAGPQGDANGDGTVNIFDINLISSNWGGGGSVPVPEPATWSLALLAALALAPKVRRARQKKP